jgi:hypothetical protein
VALSLALVLGASTAASAQKVAFVDAFVAFHSALFGTYGDEGPEVTAALERMSASLDVWEQSPRDAADARQFDAAIAAMRAAIAAGPPRAPLYIYLGRPVCRRGGTAGPGHRGVPGARALDPRTRSRRTDGLQLSETATADDRDVQRHCNRCWPQ